MASCILGTTPLTVKGTAPTTSTALEHPPLCGYASSGVGIVKRVLPFACLLLLLPLAVQAQTAASLRPGREVSLPLSEVKDTFFGYLLGVIMSGADLDIDNATLKEILTEFKAYPGLPFDLISRVYQYIMPGTGERSVGIVFTDDVDIPIPFSLLFYHPGKILVDEKIIFRVRRYDFADPAVTSEPFPVYDLALARGGFLIDIDAWLESMFRAHLEDTWIRHIVVFRQGKDWIGLMEGTGRRTPRVFRSFFDFTTNTIIFPVPKNLDAIGRALVPDSQPGI
jgi:hypothetical protein